MNFDFQRFRRYFRDISIVIVGIVITFAGSELISRWAKQREMKTVMGLIREKMKSNIERLENSVEAIQRDSVFFSYLASVKEFEKSVSLDSLERAKEALASVRFFAYKKDAFELLKNASLMQHVRDKELLLKIIEGYDILEGAEVSIKFYSDYKYRVLTDWLESLSNVERDQIWDDDSTGDFYNAILNDSKMWGFIKAAPEFINPSLCEFLNAMYRMVEMLDEEYKFKD